MLALRCLNAALALDSDHPKLMEQVVVFRSMLNNASDLAPKVSEVLKSEFKAVSESASLTEYIEESRKKHSASPRHVLSAIAAKKAIGEDTAKCEKDVVDLLNMDGVTSDDALEMLETLKSWRSREAQGFKKAAQGKWPEATRFA